MSTTTAGVLFLLVLLAALAMVHVPFGDYMFRVYTSGRDSHVERVIYRLIGVDSCAEQTRGACARSVLAFSSVSILFLFGFQLVQGTLPLHLHDPATRMAPTASGSGLDPNISPAYADLQVARVARARHVSPEQIRKLLAQSRTGRSLGILGKPCVNVLQLNLQLDRWYPVTG